MEAAQLIAQLTRTTYWFTIQDSIRELTETELATLRNLASEVSTSLLCWLWEGEPAETIICRLTH